MDLVHITGKEKTLFPPSPRHTPLFLPLFD